MPEIRIIAGSNGSGKTTFTDILSKENSVLFNFNLATDKAIHKYPELKEHVKDFVKEQLNASIEFAISKKQDVTVVTNYNNEQIDIVNQIVTDIKNEGFDAKLFYLHLNTIEDSMLRVKYREAEGGHEISAEKIKQNFIEAPENLSVSQNIYDSINIIDNSISKEIPKLIVEIQNDRIINLDLDESNKNKVSDMIANFASIDYGMQY
ncbi:MAG: hypothetical protein EOP34_04475 [Rickettsiales bacterium]|nr:MAG: hypothetical protein EOP34_04475 [Rickettsiales bacterium]